MYCNQYNILTQEVPDEISLVMEISGCPFRCEGCHSPHLQTQCGKYMSINMYKGILKTYKPFITCVCFLGGDHYEYLELYLKSAKELGIKTCLYTGGDTVRPSLLGLLDYIKIGRYIEDLGGLSSRKTNQVFLNLNTNEKLNYRFWRD